MAAPAGVPAGGTGPSISPLRPFAGGDRMSDVEAVMWRVDADPFLTSVFGSITLLDRPPDVERLRERFGRMADAVPRLRQRIAAAPLPLTPPVWEDDPDFDLDHHVRHVALAPPGGRRDLFDLAVRFVQDPLDRNRPLWRYLIVEGVEGTGAALVQKTHHTITDGVGGVRMSEHFVDLTRDASDEHRPRRPARTPSERPPPERAGLLRAPAHAVTLARSVVGGLAEDLRRPADAVRRPLRVLDATLSTARQLVVTDAARSPLWIDRSLRRRFDVFDVDFDEAHRAAKALGGSLNDLFVTAAAAGAGAYHRRLGSPVSDLRVAMPVSTRHDRSAGGNAFFPTRVLVPAGEMDPATRFAAVHHLLGTVRRNPAIGFADVLARVALVLPAPVLVHAARRQVDTIDFATSNVRASPNELFIAGARIDATYAIGPLGGTAFNLTMMSYAGALNLGLHTDAGAVARPALLRECVIEAFTELIACG